MTSLLRRTIAGAAGIALASSLLLVPTAAAQSCGTSASRDFSSMGTLGTTYTAQQLAVAPATAAPGGELTFRTTVTGAGALITAIRQFHDPALTPISARVSSYKLIGGSPSWTDESANLVRENGQVSVNSAGWTTAGGQAAALEVTYRVPADAAVGTTYDSGAGFKAVLAGVNPSFEKMGVCGSVRAANPVEAGQGSLKDLGAGSIVDGSTNAGNLSSNPSGSIAGTINKIDLGTLLRGLS